jgi:hypothetical protein
MFKHKLNSNLDITFVSTVPGLTALEDCLPQPMQKVIPNWWKDLPNYFLNNPDVDSIFTKTPTVKSCPSFIDFFSQGYVLPMWVDSLLSYDKKTDKWRWETPDQNFTWELHTKDQLISHKNPIYQGNLSYAIFKANSPWKLITKPGVSVFQLPVYYDFNPDFSVLPGLLRTDIWHTINQQVSVHSKKTEFIIERGTPLVVYFPFYREKSKLICREQTEQDKLLFSSSDLKVTTKHHFKRGKEYLKLKSKGEKK